MSDLLWLLTGCKARATGLANMESTIIERHLEWSIANSASKRDKCFQWGHAIANTAAIRSTSWSVAIDTAHRLSRPSAARCSECQLAAAFVYIARRANSVVDDRERHAAIPATSCERQRDATNDASAASAAVTCRSLRPARVAAVDQIQRSGHEHANAGERSVQARTRSESKRVRSSIYRLLDCEAKLVLFVQELTLYLHHSMDGSRLGCIAEHRTRIYSAGLLRCHAAQRNNQSRRLLRRDAVLHLLHPTKRRSARGGCSRAV